HFNLQLRIQYQPVENECPIFTVVDGRGIGPDELDRRLKMSLFIKHAESAPVKPQVRTHVIKFHTAFQPLPCHGLRDMKSLIVAASVAVEVSAPDIREDLERLRALSEFGFSVAGPLKHAFPEHSARYSAVRNTECDAAPQQIR